MYAYRSASYWWNEHHNETHQDEEDPDEYTGKTSRSQRAFHMAELCEDAGMLFETNDEEPDYSENDESEVKRDQKCNRDECNDDYDDNHYDNEYNEYNEYNEFDHIDYSEWNNFAQFLEERYGSSKDIPNLKLFYMELANERNFRIIHKCYMDSVLYHILNQDK